MKKNRWSWKIRGLSLLLCALLLPGSGFAKVVKVEETAAFSVAPERSQMVRVLLSRLNIADRMDITLDGVYSLGNRGENSMIFKQGSELTILLKNGNLIVYYEGMSFNAGASLYLTRYQGEEGKENGIRLTGEAAIYEGDLFLQAEGERISPILTIHVEDYLHGVVPYEMSNDFPLEALKAQAVTARTYALRKQSNSKAYDLVDTTNDQVYKGRVKGYDRAEKAIAETRGICGFYKDRLAECFYAASNGGQTALVEQVWSAGDYGYYAMVDDPYDLENPESLVKNFSLLKKPAKVEDVGLGFRTVLAGALREELLAQGYDAAPESLRVDEIHALALDTPAFPSSKLLTMMKITLSYSGRTRTDSVEAKPVKEEDVSLFGTLPPSPAPLESPEQTPAPTAAPTPKPIYGTFQKVEEPVSLQLSLFPDTVRAMGLSMNGSANNELLTLVEDAKRYTLQSRRYGHGLGMSQRGAEWMAKQYQKNYLEILAFYYPGLALKQYADKDRELPLLDTERLTVPGPRPTPTPRPTLMPMTEAAKAGQWYAVVSEISEESSLNLRSMPDMSGDILLRLYKNQRLLVLEKCEEEGWLKVKTDVAEGYVMEQFLKAE